MLKSAARSAWRAVVFVLGLGLCSVGIVLLVIPGPGLLVLFLGLALLATEFRWAKALLEQARVRLADLRQQRRSRL